MINEIQTRQNLKILENSRVGNQVPNGFGLTEFKKQRGVSAKIQSQIKQCQENPLLHGGILSSAPLNPSLSKKNNVLDHLKLQFHSEIQKVTDSLVKQAQKSDLGKQSLSNMNFAEPKTVENHIPEDYAVIKLTQNLIDR